MFGADERNAGIILEGAGKGSSFLEILWKKFYFSISLLTLEWVSFVLSNNMNFSYLRFFGFHAFLLTCFDFSEEVLKDYFQWLFLARALWKARYHRPSPWRAGVAAFTESNTKAPSFLNYQLFSPFLFIQAHHLITLSLFLSLFRLVSRLSCIWTWSSVTSFTTNTGKWNWPTLAAPLWFPWINCNFIHEHIRIHPHLSPFIFLSLYRKWLTLIGTSVRIHGLEMRHTWLLKL